MVGHGRAGGIAGAGEQVPFAGRNL